MANRLEDEIEIIYWGEDEDNNTVNADSINRKYKKRKEKVTLQQEIIGWLKLVIIAVVVAVSVNNLIIINAEVPSGSMERTIHKGSRMIGFRLSYVFSKPERGDIIIFKYPEDESQNFVKRVIGIPGDTVEVKMGIVYINGRALKEKYVYYEGDVISAKGDFPLTKVPQQCYFVMGDNRNNSLDSRFWENTHFVKEDEILGKAVFSYYPSFKVFK